MLHTKIFNVSIYIYRYIYIYKYFNTMCVIYIYTLCAGIVSEYQRQRQQAGACPNLPSCALRLLLFSLPRELQWGQVRILVYIYIYIHTLIHWVMIYCTIYTYVYIYIYMGIPQLAVCMSGMCKD